jgi:hypothetical protein
MPWLSIEYFMGGNTEAEDTSESILLHNTAVGNAKIEEKKALITIERSRPKNKNYI